MKEAIINRSYTIEQIHEKREKIRSVFLSHSENIKDGMIGKISTLDLQLFFQLYDEIFFENYFKNDMKEKVKFSLSTKMIRSAGKTIYSKRLFLGKLQEEYEIRMGIQFFFKYYEVNREKIVSGISTKDALEAFQIVWEHELCHLIEFYLYKESSCKKNRFKQISNQIFGHTGVYHELPTNKEIAHEKYGIQVGDAVRFDYNGNMEHGIVYGINKRATVMVLDKNGIYSDKKGNKYSKWYVSLGALQGDPKGRA